jgi:addiction module RelB/DinJ family antitoxin
MTENSVVRARIDARTKREAAAALKKIGLTVSDAFRLLLVRVAAEKALPFEPPQSQLRNRRSDESRAQGRTSEGRQAGQTTAKSECGD